MSECTCDDIILELTPEGQDGNGIVSVEKISTVGVISTYRITFTNGTYFDYQVTDGSSIASITKTSTVGLVDTYTVTLTDGTQTTFTVTNGEKGDPGNTGNGIASITKTGTVGLVDTYTILFTDGTTTTYTVTNGEQGEPGDTGNGIESIEKTGTVGLADTYRITFTDGDHFDYDVANGADGEPGPTGNGIASIEKISTVGLVDTYRITFTDGTTYDYTVTNGSSSGGGSWGSITGTLSDQTDLQTALDAKADIITASASGSVVSISDGANAPVDALSVTIEPVQSGSGDPSPDNVRPITGHSTVSVTRTGKVVGEWNYSFNNGGSYSKTISSISHPTEYQAMVDMLKSLKPGNYTYGELVNNCETLFTRGITVRFTDSSTISFTARQENGWYTYSVTIPEGLKEKTLQYISLYYGKSSGGDAPTSADIGYLKLTLTDETPEQTDTYQGQSVTIDLGSERFGGVLDVKTGVLTLTHKCIDMGDLSWSAYTVDGTGASFYAYTPSDMKSVPNTSTLIYAICSRYKRTIVPSIPAFTQYDGVIANALNPSRILARETAMIGKTPSQYASAISGTQLVYELATPIEVPLTPETLSTLLGNNVLWADTGDTNVTYRADTALYIDRKVAEANTLTRAMIADSATADGKAPKSLSTGDLIIVGDELRKATANIGSGNAITASNSTVATLADVIKALQ